MRLRRTCRGMTLIEVVISLAIMSMIVVSVWASFNGTIRGMAVTEEIQIRHAIIRNGLGRMTDELSTAYLSANRPNDETKHYTLFEGRDSFEEDSLTFSSFSHLRMRKDVNESDQSVIQYFLQDDPEERSRTHLYRRESRRLTGDRPEDFEEFFPAYVLIEDVVSLDVKYWESRQSEWIDEWRTMQLDRQPDRLPARVKVIVGVKAGDGKTAYYTAQAEPLMQERVDLGRGS